MAIEVELPDGRIAEFPDGTPHDVIERAMQQHYAASAQATSAQPRQPTREEAQRVGDEAAWRDTMRRSMPFGLGHVAQPMVNTLLDPSRRRAVGESIGGAVRAAREIPSLDLGRLGRDTVAAAREGIESLPRLPEQIMGNLPQIARAVTYGSFVDEERAQQRLDLARLQGGDTQAPAQEANASTGGLLTNVAGIGGGALVRTPLQAAATAVALDAPHALSRGDGPLQERLPGALTEMGGAAAFGAGAQTVANAAPRVLGTPTRAAQRAQEFEQAGVRPTLAAVRGSGAAPLTMSIAENPVGGNVRANLQNSLDDTARAAEGIAQGYGTPVSREVAGETVQSGVRRWASEASPGVGPSSPDLRTAYSTPTREWSFDAKASALYQHVLGRVEATENALIRGTAQRGGRSLIGSPSLTVADQSRAVLADIIGRVRNERIRGVTLDPQIRRFAEVLNDPQGRIHFGDLRELRTYVRELQKTPGLRQGLDDAGLQRLEQALTADILQSAANIGGPRAAHALSQVDKFYRKGQERIAAALRPFADARSPASAYDRIIQLANDARAGANTDALLSLKRTLNPNEWRTVASTLIDRMGRPRSGAANALEPDAFSVENFVSNYAAMSSRARRILFGSLGGGRAADDLAWQLDNLARVAGYQKGVRGFANHSRSGSSLQNIGTLTTGVGAAVSSVMSSNPAPIVALIAIGASARLTGEMLSNPSFVRWLVSAPKQGGRGGARQMLVELAKLAARDPALYPLAAELVPPPIREPAPQTSAGPRRQQHIQLGP